MFQKENNSWENQFYSCNYWIYRLAFRRNLIYLNINQVNDVPAAPHSPFRNRLRKSSQFIPPSRPCLVTLSLNRKWAFRSVSIVTIINAHHYKNFSSSNSFILVNIVKFSPHSYLLFFHFEPRKKTFTYISYGD